MIHTAELRVKGSSVKGYALLAALISLLDIVFGNSLFATLGYEYSGLMGISLSLLCGLWAVRQTCSTTSEFWRALLRVEMVALGLSALPLLLSLASLPFLSNCALLDGVVFYVEVAVPSALLGAGFGFAIRNIFARKATFLFVLFWITSFALSLLPGYTNPQIFTYGWQYGYFPGFVWDEALELTSAYAFFRVENLVWLLLLLSIARATQSSKHSRYVFPALIFVVSITFYFFHDAFHITSSESAVRAELDQTALVDPECSIYYKNGSLTSDELAKLVGDVRWFLYDIRNRFELQPDSKPIHIFLYPSSESMFWNVGTQAASIAKPWLGNVHIARGNVLSLKHELTHVLFRQVGPAPFYASWSTGLTEGSAMSVEPRYDGIFTLDQHAARILQMQFASGIRQVMSFTSFASNAPTTSYVLAGSFTRYLLRTYGAPRYKQVFRTVDWKSAYGKSLDTLEAEWKRSISPFQTPLSSEDSIHFRYYYERGTVFSTPCLRRLGKIKRRAHEAYEEHRYQDAEHLSREAFEEGGGVSALVSAADAMVQQRKIGPAAAMLDTAYESKQLKQELSLALRQADLHMMLGEKAVAEPFFQLQESVKLSSSVFTQAYHDKVIAQSDRNSLVRQYFLGQYIVSPHRRTALINVLQSILARVDSSDRSARLDLSVRYMIALTYEGDGKFKEAIRWDPLARWDEAKYMAAGPMTRDDSLAVSLVSLHMATLRPGGIRRDLCPEIYRPAFEELAKETEEHERYLQSASHRP